MSCTGDDCDLCYPDEVCAIVSYSGRSIWDDSRSNSGPKYIVSSRWRSKMKIGSDMAIHGPRKETENAKD